MRNKTIGQLNYPLLIVTLVLLACGLIMLYSASTVESFNNFKTPNYYFLHQLTYGGLIGIVAMYIFSRIDYHIWQKYIPAIIVLALLLLALVKVPGIGFGTKGADRWIHVGPIFFQPGEFAKLAIIFYIAAWVDRKAQHLNNFLFGVLPSLCIIGLFAFLIIIQPDLGTMLVLVLTPMVMLFVAGIQWKHVFWLCASGLLLLWAFVKTEGYRARRITTFFDPTIDPKGISYQINQALLAIGAGGAWGYGYGLSRQKHNYLPEAISDSIFAVMSEELGFFRILIVLGLFTAFAIQGLRVAKAAPDTFGKMLGIGITAYITIQAFINIGAMVGLLPLTGIPLPFFSYGSSSLLVTLASIGILLNISRQGVVAKARI